MQKSNLVTLSSLCFLIIADIWFMSLWKTEAANADEDHETEQQIILDTSDINISKTGEMNMGAPDIQNKPIDEQNLTVKPAVEFKDNALFIGDSRTVGLMEYAQIDNADFFCGVGMSVFNIHKKAVAVPGVGKISLENLLNSKKFSRIYIMLGLNEIGYSFEKIIEKYNELIAFVEEREPDAAIVIQANLHITKDRSDNDKNCNNKAINKLNNALSELADNKGIFYLDANVVFDDANGALSADKSSDNIHLYAKYYKEWGKWIMEQTELLMEEG